MQIFQQRGVRLAFFKNILYTIIIINFLRIFMKIFRIILIFFLGIFLFAGNIAFAADDRPEVHLTNEVSTNNADRKALDEFTGNSDIDGYFIHPSNDNGKDTVLNTFIEIARNIKNVFLFIAVAFLIFGVIKLFFSDASEEDVKKWKKNIFWTTVGIVFMQLASKIWINFLELDSGKSPLNVSFAWKFWGNIFEPIVMLFQYFASFAFLAMMIYAFYVIVTGAGDEDKLKKGKNTLIFAILGFVLIQFPVTIVRLMYAGVPECQNTQDQGLWDLAAACENKSGSVNLSGSIGLIGQIIQYLNMFLTVLCVLMAIYAGWLLFISAGDEDKVKRAKNIFIYITIGLILLVLSHAIFRFFLMQEVPTV